MDMCQRFVNLPGGAADGKVRRQGAAQFTQMKGLAQVEGHQHPAVEAVRDQVTGLFRKIGGDQAIGVGSGSHRRFVFRAETGVFKRARNRVAQLARQSLRALRHHPVALDLKIAALIHHRIKRVGDVLQFPQRHIVFLQAA